LDIKNILYQKDLKEEAQNQIGAFFLADFYSYPCAQAVYLSSAKLLF